MLLQLGYWCELNPNPFCNNYYILTLDVNAVATLFVVITTFCPVSQIGLKQRLSARKPV